MTMPEILICGRAFEDVRDASRLRDAIEQLEETGLLAFHGGIVYRVTHTGFLLADQLIALAETLMQTKKVPEKD